MPRSSTAKRLALGVTAVLVAVCILVAVGAGLFNRLRYDDFAISGDVVDEQGNPLDDVKVSVTGGRFIKFGVETKYDQRFARVSRRFRFDERRYSTVSIVFFKAEFQDQELYFTSGGEHTGLRVVLKRGSGPASYPAPPLNRQIP
jgi:hypothetical protein